jgi:hypothetical protein
MDAANRLGRPSGQNASQQAACQALRTLFADGQPKAVEFVRAHFDGEMSWGTVLIAKQLLTRDGFLLISKKQGASWVWEPL